MTDRDLFLEVPMTGSDKIAECLYEALATSDDEALRALRDAVREYRQKYHHSFNGLPPIARKLIDAIEQL